MGADASELHALAADLRRQAAAIPAKADMTTRAHGLQAVAIVQSSAPVLNDPSSASIRSHRSISDIAFSWGFSSGAYFSRVFRAQVGVSPTEYRLGVAG